MPILLQALTNIIAGGAASTILLLTIGLTLKNKVALMRTFILYALVMAVTTGVMIVSFVLILGFTPYGLIFAEGLIWKKKKQSTLKSGLLS